MAKKFDIGGVMAEFTIYNADCLDIMRVMDADSVDAVMVETFLPFIL